MTKMKEQNARVILVDPYLNRKTAEVVARATGATVLDVAQFPGGIKGTPAKFIDFAMAPDAATAEKQVAEEHKISEALRDRLVAKRASASCNEAGSPSRSRYSQAPARIAATMAASCMR